MSDKVMAAVLEYLARQERRSHPSGHTDKSGIRWYPDEEEYCSCCITVREPSRNYPWSYMVHCRTLKHVANLFKLNAEERRRMRETVKAAQAIPKAARLAKAHRGESVRVGNWTMAFVAGGIDVEDLRKPFRDRGIPRIEGESLMWDWPERIPGYVKDAARQLYLEVQGAA